MEKDLFDWLLEENQKEENKKEVVEVVETLSVEKDKEEKELWVDKDPLEVRVNKNWMSVLQEMKQSLTKKDHTFNHYRNSFRDLCLTGTTTAAFIDTKPGELILKITSNYVIV